MNEDLVKKAREYASKDDYVVTRRYISSLCDEIDRLIQLNKNVFSRIQDNKEVSVSYTHLTLPTNREV